MKAHYLQHVPFEGLGSIESWLQDAGYEISSTKFFDSGVLPNVEDVDILVVMGGPMSVNDEGDYPWLVIEKDFIRNTIEVGKPVLGICLGAQLIASSLGGNIFRNSVKEIGWYPVKAVDIGDDSIFNFPEEIMAFHWHGETFTLPECAIQIAKSKACENQAFQFGSNVIALQFHLETTPALARAIVENCNNELVEGEYIQSEKRILSASQEHYSSINSLMGEVLEYILNNNR